MRCVLYQDELEQKLICIAYGKEPDDTEITQAVMDAQHKRLEEKLDEAMDRFGIDLDDPEVDESLLRDEDAVDIDDLPAKVRKHIEFVENSDLRKTAERYHKKTHEFLASTFFKEGFQPGSHKDDFEVIAWYHTLFPAKINRALAGFHESVSEGDVSLCDAVAQFRISEKAASRSIAAWKRLIGQYGEQRKLLRELIVLLDNMLNRIRLLESRI